MVRLTQEELAAYDGRAGAPAYVAYEGRIYDVTASKIWRQGRHWARHQAGADLTSALTGAPHGAELLERYPVVGVLRPE